MRENIRILDCTLRDGGRLIDCAFPDAVVGALSAGLSEAGIDIVEVGFLRDKRRVRYEGNSTFFTDPSQIGGLIARRPGTEYTAFIDYGMYDFSDLPKRDGKSIDGIRLGFTRKDYLTSFQDVKSCMRTVKEKGYALYIQSVDTPGYSDRELLDIIGAANQTEPFSFGLVDTYGTMYKEDLQRLYSLIDYNLKPSVCLDFHSHNNQQLSFSLAQELTGMAGEDRTVIIDSTLNGMGKCSGNLNTELITHYLTRMWGRRYDFDRILDLTDDYIRDIERKNRWGYSIPSLLAGILKSHPNNVLYLTEKFRLGARDIKYILTMLGEKRQRYDYDYIEEKYIEYNSGKVDDRETLRSLKREIGGLPVLVIAPGRSVRENRERIRELIGSRHPFIISVNFVYAESENALAFFGSKKRYQELESERGREGVRVLAASNIFPLDQGELSVDYSRLIQPGWKYFDNSMIMLLRLLENLGVKEILIAGFDGFSENADNYCGGLTQHDRFSEEYGLLNRELEEMLTAYERRTRGETRVKFVTESRFSYIFQR